MNIFQSSPTSSPVYDTVLALLRSSLWGEARFPFHAPENTDWDAVYRELRQQTVQNLPVDLLCRENPAQTAVYTKNAVQNMRHWLKIMQVQQSLCQQLQSAGIPCVVLKGAAVACDYPEPTNRVMGDIDLLVAPKDFDRARQILAAAAEYHRDTRRHTKFTKNTIAIELHRVFGEMRNPEKNTILDQRLFSAIASSESVSIDHYSFPKLPAVEHGLSLLFHIDVHLEVGLGLRQILDWMLYVDKVMTDTLWYTEFEPFVNQLERRKLAITVTRMCQIYLGLREDITWCLDADEALCKELMEYIFLQGNFGKKTQKGLNRAVSIIQSSKNITSFFQIMQHQGCRKWPALTHYPCLKPFAWLYQIIRYISLGFRMKHPLLLLKNALKTSHTSGNLMEELGVSRIGKTN